MDAFAIEAVAPFVASVQGDILVRTIALRGDQTLEDLHEALRLAFGWADPHLYAFWPGSRWWDPERVSYRSPYELEDGEPDEHALSARIKLLDIPVRKGKRFAYVFDFGDEWRLLLRVTERWKAEGEPYPQLLEAIGTPPPQYEEWVPGEQEVEKS